MGKKVRAIGMISGGLDSTLAMAVVKNLGVEVLAVTFQTGFGVTEIHRGIGWKDRSGHIPQDAAEQSAQQLGVKLLVVDVIGPEYNDMLLNPKFGYGKNFNPCIDCHAFMLRKCKELMATHSAQFVFTGEVLGQRPMSQRLHALRQVEQAAGLPGLVLRPLSARALPPTIPEQEGLIDRNALYDIVGRGRTQQMSLARELGITDYPSPAGGCFLTEENYSRRLRDLVKHTENPVATLGRNDYLLLGLGRHFRLSPKVAFVIGRDAAENQALESFVQGRWRLEALDHAGPTTLVLGAPETDDLKRIAAITAGYGQGRDQPQVAVTGHNGEEQREFLVTPERGQTVSRLQV